MNMARNTARLGAGNSQFTYLDTDVYRAVVTLIEREIFRSGSTPEQTSAAAFLEETRLGEVLAYQGEPLNVLELFTIANALDIEPGDLIPSTSYGELA